MNKPLITIGITSFNSEKTIGKAINSALEQLWRPLEIVVVDDCSIDNSYEIIKELKKKNSELRIFRNSKNQGVAFCRNKIIEKSNGEFLAFFDDDDISFKDRLIEQYLRITNYEESVSNAHFVFCHAARKLLYRNKNYFIEDTMGQKLEGVAPNGISVAKRILIGLPLKNGYGSMATCSQMARVQTYKDMGGFDNFFRRSEDTDLIIRSALKGAHFVGISKILVIQNMTNNGNKNFYDETFYFKKVIEKYKNIMSKKEFNFVYNWMKLKLLFFQNKILEIIFLLVMIFIRFPFLTLMRLLLSIRNIIKNFYFSKFLKNLI